MSKKKGKANAHGVKSALVAQSHLLQAIEPGLRALGKHSTRIDECASKVVDSLDFDAATTAHAPEANRWDYFLGASGRGIVGVEVHSAKESEVSVVIVKRRHSKPAFEAHLKDGISVARWIWIASGKVKFSPNSKYLLELAKNRIEFEGRKLKL